MSKNAGDGIAFFTKILNFAVENQTAAGKKYKASGAKGNAILKEWKQ